VEPPLGCVCGMAEQAAAWIEVVRSRLKPWGGVSGVSTRRCEESGWHAGRHDLAQDESKCAHAGRELGLRCSTEKCCGTRCKVPRLHWGQDRLSADVCGSVSSVLVLGEAAWRWVLHRARA
jgi:hypothetical protein